MEQKGIKHYLNEAMTPKTKLTIGARTAWCGKEVFYRQNQPNNHTNIPDDVTCKECKALLQSAGCLNRVYRVGMSGNTISEKDEQLVCFDEDLMRTLLRVACTNFDVVTFKKAAQWSGITVEDLRGIRRRNLEFASVLKWVLDDNKINMAHR